MAAILIVSRMGPATSDAPLLLARAFTRLGCPARIFAMDEDLPSSERVLEPLGVRHDHPLWLHLFNRRLCRELARVRPALLFLFGSNWKVLPETLEHARRQGTATALWECNHWLTAPHQRQALRHYDCYFDLDSYFLDRARVAGARRVEHLPGCADPDEHFPVTLDAAERERYGAEVSFIGSPYPERLPFLEALGKRRLKVWGNGWDRVASPILQAGAVVREPVYGLKKTKIYRASAINLNIQGARMVHGENFRLFEIGASGAFCLTTPKPDLGRWFRLGEDLETFDDVATLDRQVARFLADPVERAERAARARATVLAAHTYGHRAAQVLEALGLGTAPAAAVP
jgi:spore maturation protein CgeB